MSEPEYVPGPSGQGRKVETWGELESMLNEWLSLKFWMNEEKLTRKTRLVWLLVGCVALAGGIYCLKEVLK